VCDSVLTRRLDSPGFASLCHQRVRPVHLSVRSLDSTRRRFRCRLRTFSMHRIASTRKRNCQVLWRTLGRPDTRCGPLRWSLVTRCSGMGGAAFALRVCAHIRPDSAAHDRASSRRAVGPARVAAQSGRLPRDECRRASPTICGRPPSARRGLPRRLPDTLSTCGSLSCRIPHAPRHWTSYPPQVTARPRDVDMILHAGDVCTPDVLDELSS